jgi:hypothetical protein
MAERPFGGRSPHHRDTGEPSARPRSISVKRERALDPSPLGAGSRRYLTTASKPLAVAPGGSAARNSFVVVRQSGSPPFGSRKQVRARLNYRFREYIFRSVGTYIGR